MIREVKLEKSLGQEGKEEKYLIRRRLIPIELTVHKGQYQTFRQKLPYKTRLSGIIITSQIPWEDEIEP